MITTLALFFLLAAGCATGPTVSTVPFQESRSETVERSGLRISTDWTAEKIKVQNADLEIILPLAGDWSLTPGSKEREILWGVSRELKMMLTVHHVNYEGSAEEYLSSTMRDIIESLKRTKIPITNERIITHGADRIYTHQSSYKTFFNFARKAPSGRILHLMVSVMGAASRRDVAVVEQSVLEILVPSFVALK